jgi:hypothetical protein
MSTPAQRTPFLPIRLLDRLALPVSRTFHNPSNRNSVLSVSSRFHSAVKHISHDRLYSNSTHPHCRSPAGPRAVSLAPLQVLLHGSSAFLRRSPYHYLFPIVELFLLAPNLLRALHSCAFRCGNFDKIRPPRIHTHSRVTQSRAARRQISDALACYKSDHRHAGSTSSASKVAKRPQRINLRPARVRLARLPQPLCTASSGRFVLFLPLSSKK